VVAEHAAAPWLERHPSFQAVRHSDGLFVPNTADMTALLLGWLGHVDGVLLAVTPVLKPEA
jgi:hypothetical protein